MNKKIYTVITFALMGLLPISAHDFKKNRVKSQVLATEHVPDVVNSKLPNLVSASQLRTVNAATLNEGVTTKKTVPVGFVHTAGTSADPEASLKYDKYGNITEIDYDDNSVEKIDYEYNSHNQWISRTVTKIANNKEIAKTMEIRTFDSQGRIIAIDKKGYDYDKQEEYPISSYAYSYDMVTPDTDSDKKAYVVKNLTYEKKGEVYVASGKEYVWFEPANAFIECNNDNWEQEKVKIVGDTYVKTSQKTSWDGIVKSVDYQKCEAQVNQPQQGYNTLTYSSSENGSDWTYGKRVVMTANFNDDYFVFDGKAREISVYFYDTDTKQFEFSYKNVYEWAGTSGNILKVSYFDSEDTDESDVNYYLVKDGIINRGSESLYLAENGSYVIGAWSNSDDCDYYTFYTAQGEEYRKMKIRDYETPGLSPNIVEEYKNGEWQPVKNETLTLGSGDNRFLFETNGKGWCKWSEDYIDGVLDLKCVAEYAADGYTVKYYTTDKSTGKIIADGSLSGRMLADGSQEVIEVEPDGDGSNEDKEKTVYQKDGIKFVYSWDEEANDWKVSYVKVPDLVTTTADGTTTTIARSWENGSIVENGKNVEVKNADGSLNYKVYYIKNGNDWMPDTKTVYTAYSIPETKCILPTNPLPGIIPARIFSDIYLVPAQSGMEEDVQGWDKDTNEWTAKTCVPNSYETGEEEGLNVVTINLNGASYRYVIDDQNRLNLYEGPGLTCMFEYDKDGRITQLVYGGNGVEAYYLVYGEIDVVNGISHPTTAQVALHLGVSGRTVTVVGSKHLQLYSIDGKLVGESLQGSVTAPSVGTYIVVADGYKAKIALR